MTCCVSAWFFKLLHGWDSPWLSFWLILPSEDSALCKHAIESSLTPKRNSKVGGLFVKKYITEQWAFRNLISSADVLLSRLSYSWRKENRKAATTEANFHQQRARVWAGRCCRERTLRGDIACWELALPYFPYILPHHPCILPLLSTSSLVWYKLTNFTNAFGL